MAGGLVSLAHATARFTGAGDARVASVELSQGVVVARPMGGPSDGGVLVLTRGQADLGHVGYELAVLVSQVRRALDLDCGAGGPAGVRPLR